MVDVCRAVGSNVAHDLRSGFANMSFMTAYVVFEN